MASVPGAWAKARAARPEELDALKYGLDLGYPLIDTAEMYGEGVAEEIVGDALQGRSSRPFIVSKVYPHNASRAGTIAACERSLKRMRLERIDLYLLHWRGGSRIEETFEAFHKLKHSGKIGDFGVSNFDLDDMEDAAELDKGLNGTNQVLYCLSRRGPEFDLLPVDAQAFDPADGLFAARPGRLAAPSVAQEDCRPRSAARRHNWRWPGCSPSRAS